VSAYGRPRPLEPGDRTSMFDSGAPELDEWLGRHARTAAAAGSARTFVSIADDERVAGFYALAAGAVERAAAR
jgi:hypothetical protein